MRTGAFGDFVLLGSQYKDETGELNWYIALLPRGESETRIYHIVGGELPDGLVAEERDVVIQAIRLWEAEPISRPS